MSNMAYCRFQNTLTDLQDCVEHIFDDDLDEQEQKARKYLIDTCKDILGDLGYVIEDSGDE